MATTFPRVDGYDIDSNVRAAGLAILVVACGLTVTSHSGRIGDIAYHVALLIDLVVALGLLMAGRQTHADG